MTERVVTKNENKPVVYDFPADIRDMAISVDEFWGIVAQAPDGWHAATLKKDHDPNQPVQMMRNLSLHKRQEIIPPFIDTLRYRYAESSTLSCFTSAGVDDLSATLPWHCDGYDVFAFNMEGETSWEYFDWYEGKVKSIDLGEMDKLLYMPCGITHRVILRSESRTSVSIVAPGKCNGNPCRWDKD